MIKGNKVELVPAELSDRQNIYDWCYHSEKTKTHSGPPDYPENPIATWEEFFAFRRYSSHSFGESVSTVRKWLFI